MKKCDEISTVASIGGGPIGGGWAAHFLAKGLKVKAYLHSKDEVTQYNDIIKHGDALLNQIHRLTRAIRI